MKNIFFTLLLLGAFLAGPARAVVYPWDLLPADNAVAGWVKKDTTKYKVWQDAQYPNNYLYDFIDGGAPVYTDKGFIRGAIINYTKQGQDILIYLYEFVNADSAHRLYQSLDPTSMIPAAANLGTEARLEELLFNAGLEVRQGTYYMKLTLPSGENDAAKALAGVMVQNINAAPVRDVIRPAGPLPAFRLHVDGHLVHCWSAAVPMVFDQTGRSIRPSIQRSPGMVTLNLSGRAAGVCFVQLNGGPHGLLRHVLVTE
jgi:hypothetical protein